MDCVLLVTDHSCFDYSWILEHSKLIVDTRNVYRIYSSDKVKKARWRKIYWIYRDILNI